MTLTQTATSAVRGGGGGTAKFLRRVVKLLSDVPDSRTDPRLCCHSALRLDRMRPGLTGCFCEYSLLRLAGTASPGRGALLSARVT